MLPTLVAVQVALASPARAGPLRLVAPEMRVTNVQPSLAKDFTDHLAQQLVARGLTVVTASDVAALVSLERQKQLFECADEATSCVTELAGALGADAVVLGTVARAGHRFQVNVRVVDARDAKPLAVFSEQCEREDDLFRILDRAAQALFDGLSPLMAARGWPSVKAGSGPARRWWPIPAAATAALGITSALCFGGAASAAGELRRSGAPDDFDPIATAAGGQRFETFGWVSASLAAAALATTAWLLTFGTENPSLAVAPEPQGASLTVGGAW